MGDKTRISWTATVNHEDGSVTAGASWNPIRGTLGKWTCVRVSPGCQFCYAAAFNVRLKGPEYVVGADTPRLDEAALTLPLRWRRPRKIFVCSMTDIAGEWVPDEWLERIWAVMALAPHHTFILLTKRPRRLADYLANTAETRNMLRFERLADAASRLRQQFRGLYHVPVADPGRFPYPHVWIGVTAEDQPHWDERVPILRRIPAAVRWVSVEPMLGPITGVRDCRVPFSSDWDGAYDYGGPQRTTLGIHWLVAGGESAGPAERCLVEPCPKGPVGYACPECHGTGWRLKPTAAGWVRSLRDQCAEAGVPFFWKQLGGPRPTSGGHLLDGREYHAWPKGGESHAHE